MMKKLLQIIIEKIEKHGNYMPYTLTDDTPTNSHR